MWKSRQKVYRGPERRRSNAGSIPMPLQELSRPTLTLIRSNGLPMPSGIEMSDLGGSSDPGPSHSAFYAGLGRAARLLLPGFMVREK